MSHDDPGLCVRRTGVILSVSGAMCSIFLPYEDRVVNIMRDHLDPVHPNMEMHLIGKYFFHLPLFSRHLYLCFHIFITHQHVQRRYYRHSIICCKFKIPRCFNYYCRSVIKQFEDNK